MENPLEYQHLTGERNKIIAEKFKHELTHNLIIKQIENFIKDKNG